MKIDRTRIGFDDSDFNTPFPGQPTVEVFYWDKAGKPRRYVVNEGMEDWVVEKISKAGGKIER